MGHDRRLLGGIEQRGLVGVRARDQLAVGPGPQLPAPIVRRPGRVVPDFGGTGGIEAVVRPLDFDLGAVAFGGEVIGRVDG